MLKIDCDGFVNTKHFRAAPAGPDEIPHLAAHLREGDRLEIERGFSGTPEEVLKESLGRSVLAWTAFTFDGVPVAMWGAAKFPQDSHYGVPWLLGTDDIGQSYPDFLRLSRFFDNIMSRWFWGLANMVDVEYDGAIRWLEWLGYRRDSVVKTSKGYDFVIMAKNTAHVW
ncbi:MAG: hypothetical protein LUG50_06815 [Planctomycetaceae bacterium]|nr:hypothetical protein [Planctomycetaceae bacterium]